MSKYMITNGEFKEFVHNGGYENPSYWDEEAWQWKNSLNSPLVIIYLLTRKLLT
ncbi:MAG: hypothetical protein ACKO8H_12955 [Microcystis panniformis]